VPEAEYSTTARLPVQVIWDYVQEMDNWAPFLRGYQSHEKLNEKESTWVLKGDVGAVSRTVKFFVTVEEWNGPSQVRFVLKGLNEQMEGSGEFRLAAYEEEDAGSREEAPARPGLFARLLQAIARFFYQLFAGKTQRAASADAGPGEGMARLTFRLRVTPGGPMGPMIDAMMKPIMLPVAEELANKIMAELEQRHGVH